LVRVLRATFNGLAASWYAFLSPRAAPTENKEDLRGHYFDTATQYYVSARYAYFAHAIPTAGNLFHHAIEMYLKGCLVGTHNEAERRRLGHNLDRIWRRLKRQIGEQSLSRFDATIADLNAFEDLRYPEKVRGRPIHFELVRPPTETSGSRLKTTGQFQLFLNEIDHLVSVLFHQATLNPKFFTVSLSASGRALLTKDNPTGIW
jgi:hypothetical protein